MGLSIVQVLGLLTFVVFIMVMFLTKQDKNRLFIKYLLCAYPLIAVPILPGSLPLNSFNIITYAFFFMFYKRRNVQLQYSMFYKVILAILIIQGMISCITAESITIETLRTAIEMISVFIFAKILIEECLDDPLYYYNVIDYLKITLAISLIFLGCQFVFGVNFNLAASLNPNVLGDGLTRYPGIFQDPQKFAQFLAATSFFCLIKYWNQIKLPPKNYLLLFLTLVGILYTGGRGGLGGWALGFAILTIFGNPKYRVSAIITGLVLFVVIYNFKNDFAVFKREDNLADSYDFRYGIWQDSYKIFLDNPVVGIGPGNYANYVSVHNPDQFWFINNEPVYYDNPESGYLKLLTENGAIGFICYLLLIITPVAWGLLNYRKYKDISILLLIAAIASWVAGFYTVYSLGDTRILVLITTILCLLIVSYKRFIPQDDQTEII